LRLPRLACGAGCRCLDLASGVMAKKRKGK